MFRLHARWPLLAALVIATATYTLTAARLPVAAAEGPPFTLALVLGSRAEDAFRLSMIGSGGDVRVFWSNGLVGSITTLAILLLFWPVIDRAVSRLSRSGSSGKI